MKIGEVRFEDGDCIQGWNPKSMTRETRDRIADELEDIAARMRQDLFEEDGELVHYEPMPE